MLKKNLSFFTLCIFVIFATLHAENEMPKGTLIVTYQTGANKERLERIRFYLIDENKNCKIYPKNNAFVDDPYNASRMVVVENLKAGKYQIEFLVPNTDNMFDSPSKREVTVSPLKVTKIDQVIKPRYASIRILTSVLPEGEVFETIPLITLKNTVGDIKIESSGGKIINHQLIPGNYLLTFHELPGFASPDPIDISLGPNENLGPIEGIYTKLEDDNVEINNWSDLPFNSSPIHEIQKTVFVPGGKSIIGNPQNLDQANTSSPQVVNISAFNIGTFVVTNALFAEWLNKTWREGKIVYHNQSDKRGHVTDKEGRLLFKTHEANAYSQIYTHTTPEGPHFLTMVGKHNFPVILVSWFGAQAYCESHQLRLPSEAEWEKAAGMENTPQNTSLKKFCYGFSQDSIDHTWANYRNSNNIPETLQVLTTRVGFYNGVNKLPKTPSHPVEITTHKAQSPCGAYDMSGNVWEWVNDWYSDDYYTKMDSDNPKGPSSGTKKVAKGGCYNSLVEGVRVAERLALPPEHTDIYTGFRVAADIP